MVAAVDICTTSAQTACLSVSSVSYCTTPRLAPDFQIFPVSGLWLGDGFVRHIQPEEQPACCLFVTLPTGAMFVAVPGVCHMHATPMSMTWQLHTSPTVPAS